MLYDVLRRVEVREASSQEVFDNILGQLTTAGRFSQDVSKAQATVVRDFFTVERGYPADLSENGIPTRDMVWMSMPL